MTEYEDPIINEILSVAPFPVEVDCTDYPDVIFNVMFDSEPDSNTVQTCVATLDKYMNTYNRRRLFNKIHYVSDVDKLPPQLSIFAVSIHMDFGHAHPRALVGAVKALVSTDLPITRLYLE